MGQLGKIETELKKTGAVVYSLSNEGADDLKTMKTAEKLGSVFVFLSDREAKGTDNYAGQTMLNPATFVIGKSGKIVYAYVGEDYKVRANAKTVLQAVGKARK